MAEAVVYTKEGKESGKAELDPALFARPVKDHLIWEYVKQYLANQRLGTAETPNRKSVSGGTAKPWRQKGTGRARAGSNTSAVWVRGNKAFGPRPRDYYSVIPKKKRRGAMLCVLSLKANESKVGLMDDLAVSAPKTKEIASIVKTMNLDEKKNLFVVDKFEKNLFLAARNLKGTEVIKAAQVNPYDILNSENVIFTKKSIAALKTRLSEKESES
jgi:large subunit ribosomal protein L4